MDFIVEFLKLEDIGIGLKYNNILVIINKLTKYVLFILYMEIFEVK